MAPWIGRGERMSAEPEHRSILAVDIEGYSRGDRTNLVRLALRRRLRELLVGALGQAGAGADQYRLADTGDGFLVTVSSEVPKPRLLDPLLGWLARELAAGNRLAAPPARMRLRVAVHAGEVLHDPHPLVGHPVILVSRLLDAPALRAALASSGAPLAVIVSDWVYQEVVSHRYGSIDPAAYRRVRVTVKETDTYGWLYVPGGLDAAPPDPPQPQPAHAGALPPRERHAQRHPPRLVVAGGLAAPPGAARQGARGGLVEAGGGEHHPLARPGGLVLADVVLPQVDPERLAWARANPSGVDVHLLRELRAVTMAAARAMQAVTPASLLPAARSHFAYLHGLLQGSQKVTVRRQLSSVAGEAALLASALCSMSGQLRDGARYVKLARALAREAGDDVLAAEAALSRSYLYSPRYRGAKGDPTVALRFLMEAEELGLRLSAPMRGWLAGCKAAELACLGDGEAARRELGRAEDALAEINPGEEVDFLALWEPRRLDSYVGLCATLLGQGREAEEALLRALRDIDPKLVRHRIGILVDLGVAFALQGEVGEACRVLMQACTLASQYGLPVVVQRIQQVRAERLSGSDPHVKALDACLREALANPLAPGAAGRGGGKLLVERKAGRGVRRRREQPRPPAGRRG